MNPIKVTEEYIARFPVKLQEALKMEEKYRNKFVETVQDEYAEVVVYRGLHRANEVNYDDFLSNVEETVIYDKVIKRITLGHYAISVNEDLRQMIKTLDIPNARIKIYGVAKGVMRKEYGPADFPNGTHHNWYLFKDSIEDVKSEFELVDIEAIKGEDIGE